MIVMAEREAQIKSRIKNNSYPLRLVSACFKSIIINGSLLNAAENQKRLPQHLKAAML